MEDTEEVQALASEGELDCFWVFAFTQVDEDGGGEAEDEGGEGSGFLWICCCLPDEVCTFLAHGISGGIVSGGLVSEEGEGDSSPIRASMGQAFSATSGRVSRC